MSDFQKYLKIFCNNKLIVLSSNNKKSLTKPKHINIKYLVVKKTIQNEEMSIKYIGTNSMIADLLTKGLLHKVFIEYTTHIEVFHWKEL